MPELFGMKIPPEAIIAPEKLSEYLLAWRPTDDKSRFLEQAGFARQQPEKLAEAIRHLAASAEAWEDGRSEYGIFYRLEGLLRGPNDVTLDVVLIWLQWHLDETFHLVTLKPRKGLRSDV